MKQVTPTAGPVAIETVSGFSLPAGQLPAGIVGGAQGRGAAAVALRAERGGEGFQLILLDEAGAPLLAFGSYPEEEVVAEWRTLAASSGLELKIQLLNGALVTPYPQLGRVQLGATRQRRRHNLLNHRRPRFLTRRKTARFPLRPQVHREAEMAGGAGER